MAQITLNSSGVASSGTLALQSNGTTTAVTIDASQNVGIGTSSPFADTGYVSLDIRGLSTGSQINLGTTATRVGQITCDTTNGLTFNTATSTPIRFFTNGGERARIDSSGQVFFSGLSSVPYLGFNNVGIISMRNGNTGSSNRAAAFGTNETTSSNVVSIFNNNGEIGSISTSGSTTTFSTSSDYRLKENVQPMQGALAALNQLNPVTYTWKTDGSSGQGFIAHEIQAIVPECVIGEKDAVETYIDQDGNEQTRPVYQGIDTSFLVATLTAAIKEQQAIITSLTDRITALEAK